YSINKANADYNLAIKKINQDVTLGLKNKVDASKINADAKIAKDKAYATYQIATKLATKVQKDEISKIQQEITDKKTADAKKLSDAKKTADAKKLSDAKKVITAKKALEAKK
ncbi:MAG: hypothetical protein SCG72_04325, partial [Nitrosarchaeum sp.]|nr:hypothetical protein [Nitrosarchaeum sp.]